MSSAVAHSAGELAHDDIFCRGVFKKTFFEKKKCIRCHRRTRESARAMSVLRVPVTVLTGSLGAGKTTLLRRVLSAAGELGLRVAVIENEFAGDESSGSGSAGVESLILASGGDAAAAAAGYFELPNGCLCCSARAGLVDALARVLRAAARLDRVVVECSGLADPGRVAAAFWTDAEEAAGGAARLALDAVVAVVDGAHFEAARARPRPAGAVNEVDAQLACADVVLLNKMDLLHAAADGEARERRLRAAVRGVNAAAELLPCTSCDVPLERLLAVGAYGDGGGALHHLQRAMRHAADCEEQHEHGGGCGGAAHGGISSWVWRQPAGAAAPTHAEFRLWMAALIWEKRIEGEPASAAAAAAAAAGEGEALNVLRVKGVLRLRECPSDDDEGEGGSDGSGAQRYIVQGVHDVFELQPLRLPAPSAAAAAAEEVGAAAARAAVNGPGALIVIGAGVAAAAARLGASLARLCSGSSSSGSGSDLAAS